MKKLVLVLLLAALTFGSCKKEEVDTVVESDPVEEVDCKCGEIVWVSSEADIVFGDGSLTYYWDYTVKNYCTGNLYDWTATDGQPYVHEEKCLGLEW
jgi:hypothetical protein